MNEADVIAYLSTRTVLVIEDEPDSLQVMSELLDMFGAKVLLAKDGAEGLEQAQSHHPNFIISDLSMPRMSGWDLVDVLQKDRSTQHIPVIALTAHAMPGDRERALAAGFHNYITKPIQPETFLADLIRILTSLDHRL